MTSLSTVEVPSTTPVDVLLSYKMSDFENDTGYVTSAYLSDAVSGKLDLSAYVEPYELEAVGLDGDESQVCTTRKRL